ncbi:45007_t:CDS:2 [Gigaspora margarita]|uniref:45007_t:CDS:1 n=1 Tax=Gigaspora margarita TaxID=4874 RepID=A0ABM8W6J6_GIGMA|nr:45007_t:CDS:2 [Gigaspora margarita]
MDPLDMYLYCGIVDFQNQNNEIILELLVAADELGIQRFIDSVQEFVIKNVTKFLQSNPIKMLDLVICNNAFNELKKVSLEIICETPEMLFNSGMFLSLEKDHPTFQSDVKKFTSNNFETLEKTLHELIQFIRFHQINDEEFTLEIWPFRHLIPDNLLYHQFNAVHCANHYVPTFEDGHDLYVPNNSNNWQSQPNSYPQIGIPISSTSSDYEKFQVVKN